MGETRIVGSRVITVEKELQDGETRIDAQVEGPVDEPEPSGSPKVETIERLQQGRAFEGHCGAIQRREAELAFVGAAPRGFDIQVAVCDVLVAVELVGQLELSGFQAPPGDQMIEWPVAMSGLPGECLFA
ncbi:MAG: hypothetical protein EBU84_19650 [Actinobacteria bacterium]|nr:hypothetical protein [Actinomycetota bacterium]